MSKPPQIRSPYACSFCGNMPPPMTICNDTETAAICETCIRLYAGFLVIHSVKLGLDALSSRTPEKE